MKNEVYIVYVIYYNTVERMYAFNSEKSANIKRLELLKEWVNEDQFEAYLEDNLITKSEVTINTYDDYLLEIEDDSYVGIDLLAIQD